MKVAILLDYFGPVPAKLRAFWDHYEKRGELIDWDIAQVYFRKPEVSLDMTQTPPVIGPWSRGMP